MSTAARRATDKLLAPSDNRPYHAKGRGVYRMIEGDPVFVFDAWSSYSAQIASWELNNLYNGVDTWATKLAAQMKARKL